MKSMHIYIYIYIYIYSNLSMDICLAEKVGNKQSTDDNVPCDHSAEQESCLQAEQCK